MTLGITHPGMVRDGVLVGAGEVSMPVGIALGIIHPGTARPGAGDTVVIMADITVAIGDTIITAIIRITIPAIIETDVHPIEVAEALHMQVHQQVGDALHPCVTAAVAAREGRHL